MSAGTPARAEPVAVALAGAGPWATNAYAPMLAAGPETRLAGVWARRGEAARELAAAHGVPAFTSFEALLASCEAVAFAVPPDVQAELGVLAARAGRHLMLDKPLALELPDAERLAEAALGAGCVTQLMLTHRFRSTTSSWLEQARASGAIGARLAFLSGAFVRGPYACPWRREHGALHDLGPHAFDLLEGALGPIVHITGRGDPRRWVSLACEHEGGAVSDLSLSGVMTLPQTVFTLECYGPQGALAFDAVAASAESPWGEVRRLFARAVRGGPRSPHDVRRGLELQRLIAMAIVAVG
ncbi:MAG: Gfo/Idh/MocA family oxidoreductase [Candidatus Eisenbacteria bacterium]|nr:Gfo/Idh/MocA family oxidoreductase [Candidatus Eisenbacteria bacterium]